MSVSFAPQSVKDFAAPPLAAETKVANLPVPARSAQTSGAPEQFPFEFQPYLSLQYHDGRAANLPWMQELPDPASSAMWDLPVEVDTKPAATLNIANGD